MGCQDRSKAYGALLSMPTPQGIKRNAYVCILAIATGRMDKRSVARSGALAHIELIDYHSAFLSHWLCQNSLELRLSKLALDDAMSQSQINVCITLLLEES